LLHFVKRGQRLVEVLLKHSPPAVGGARNEHEGGIPFLILVAAASGGISLIADRAENGNRFEQEPGYGVDEDHDGFRLVRKSFSAGFHAGHYVDSGIFIAGLVQEQILRKPVRQSAAAFRTSLRCQHNWTVRALRSCARGAPNVVVGGYQ